MRTQGITPARAFFFVAVALMLTGCAAAPSQAAPTASATASVPRAAPARPTPTPTPTAVRPTCKTALAPAAYADFASSGLTAHAYSGWRTDLYFMINKGGIACSWHGSGDSMMVFGQLAMTSDDWDVERASLLAHGFVEQDSPPGYLNEPDTDPNSNDGGFLYLDGQLYYVSYPALVKWVPALAAMFE